MDRIRRWTGICRDGPVIEIHLIILTIFLNELMVVCYCAIVVSHSKAYRYIGYFLMLYFTAVSIYDWNFNSIWTVWPVESGAWVAHFEHQ